MGTDVLAIMTSSLVYKRPYNTARYASKNDKEKLVPHGPAHPLFDSTAVAALFDSTDILKTGTISYATAVNLARVMGINDPEGTFEAFLEHDTVFKHEFLKMVSDSMVKSTAHYVDSKRSREKCVKNQGQEGP